MSFRVPDTIYIPRIHLNVNSDTIIHSFQFYDLADVVRIDWIHKYSDDGTRVLFKQAFVHLIWRDNEIATNLRTRIEEAYEGTANAARLVYDDPYFWLLLKAHTPLPPGVTEDSQEMLVNPQLVFERMNTMMDEFDLPDEQHMYMKETFQSFGMTYNNLKQMLTETTNSYNSAYNSLYHYHAALEQNITAYNQLMEYCRSQEDSARHWEALANQRLKDYTAEAQKSEELTLFLEGARARVSELKGVIANKHRDSTRKSSIGNVWEVVDIPNET